ncbi:anti-sigma H sporulation factor, LonB [Caldithrix abyssi DSM 13497]|uniref:Lon protease n=2 Tax=Caldithrix abyssi DSM 13497 TaxID=880073 RepID=H1XRU7_CALAY|nr:endopeptidase La [Caldithrix abyssi]EHO41307.1 anti-sigma H sporulation factor, LonB [Caldithrix abyssi DSM 13497]
MMKSVEIIELDLSKQYSITVLPLKDLVFFPHMVVPLIVGRQQSIEAVESAMKKNRLVFLVAQRNPEQEVVTGRDLHRFGVLGRILQVVELPNNLLKVLVEGLVRASVYSYRKQKNIIYVTLKIPQHEVNYNDQIEAWRRELISLFKTYVRLNEDLPEELIFSVNQMEDIEKVTDFIASYLDIKLAEKQFILEQYELESRLPYMLHILNRENNILDLKSELDTKVRDQMMKTQRNYYLQEQLRVIREELGEEGEEGSDVAILRKRFRQKVLPQEAHQKVEEELTRLAKIPPLSPEYNVIRTFLEWILNLPWQEQTHDETSLEKAQKILDEDHYGLEKAKKRILEHIAVLQRVKQIKGPILCLAGPPGVGKTSLGRSIARALGRKFVRISLGGIHDEAEIRGHRRTYIGSMPGKIIQGMKKAGTVNPVFLLDEVDKINSDYRGDPASALLEVLDPEQNHSFIDHYLEVEYDLSKVFFVVTANNPDAIPEPLLDRMEVIELPGYLDYEKLAIARQYLIPKQLELNGLKAEDLEITDDALNEIIINYTLEAGVRNLEREISKICRQAVIQLSKVKEPKKLVVSKKNLSRYLGEPKYAISKLKGQKEIGVATGLAWTPFGGDLLRVEVNLIPGKDKLTLTGKLGEVMQESAMIAVDYIRSRFRKFKIDQNFTNKYEVHIHLPEGAVPKEGPSAGVTLTSGLISALKKQPLPADLAMTGEITLRGKILSVGGLQEKLMAARRHGIKRIILPAENKPDVREMSKELLEGLELIFVKDYEQIYDLLFKK